MSSLHDLVLELRETRAAAGSTATIQELRDELRSISVAVNEYVFCNNIKHHTTPPHHHHHYSAAYTRSPDSMNGGVIRAAAVPQWTSVTPSYSDPTPSALPPPPHNTINKPVVSDNGYVPPPTTGPDPPHPAQFMEVLEMLSRGETPSNVRTDITDAPPDPTQSPTEVCCRLCAYTQCSYSTAHHTHQGRLAPRPKPWEQRAHSESSKGSPSPSPLQEQVANTWRPPPLPKTTLYSPEAPVSE